MKINFFIFIFSLTTFPSFAKISWMETIQISSLNKYRQLASDEANELLQVEFNHYALKCINEGGESHHVTYIPEQDFVASSERWECNIKAKIWCWVK